MLARLRRRRVPGALPVQGWPPGPPSPVDDLSDAALLTLNELLPWQCFTVDAHGRRLGDRAWSGKREEPQPIPDRRIVMMDERFGLAGTRVLEVGCFEGVHTIGLSQLGAIVTAIDARPENVAKTLVRAGLYGCTPRVLVRDLEEPDALDGLEADLAHHVGVLYHLDDPVTHLTALGKAVAGDLMLDTHVATSGETSYDVGGTSFAFSPYAEAGRADVFSGTKAQAKWLTLDSLRDALAFAGWSSIDLAEERLERNGPRVLLFARR